MFRKGIQMKRLVFAFSLILISSAAIFAQAPPGTPAKNGQVSFNFGATQVSYSVVQGTFQQSYGFNVIGLTFSADGKPTGDNLIIGLMIQKPGLVDMKQMGNGIQRRSNGTIYSYQPGKSQCTMTVTTLTAASVEGTAECSGIDEVNGQGKKSLTSVKFSATAK
jgi:hypothetical protein